MEGQIAGVVSRINALTADSVPQWGRMNVAQMLAHCAEVQEVLNGKKLKSTPLLLRIVKGMIRKAVVNEVPYKRNSGTHPQYITSKGKFDFETANTELSEEETRLGRKKATEALALAIATKLSQNF